MARFKFKIGEREKFEKNPFIKYYPKIFDRKFFEDVMGHRPGGGDAECNLAYNLGGDSIYISLNNINLGWNDYDEGIGEYIWFFYLHMFKAVQELIKGKEYVYNFLDGAYSLIFKPVNQNYVLITFDWIIDYYFPKLKDKIDQLRDVSVPFDECIDELYNVANEYIEILLKINSRLSESDELKQLIEARDKAKKAIISYKQKPK